MTEKKHWIYLDNSATTALCDEARDAMEIAMDTYGNPSSLHGAGQAAHTLLERARGQVAKGLGVKLTRPAELIFTASGTEASNQAIFGSVYAKSRRIGKRIITTDSEHPSVARAMERLEQEGFDVVRIPTKGGILDVDMAVKALQVPTVLVSMMLVNNETGARYEVEPVFATAKALHPETLTHCDAVQGFMKVPFTPATLKADLVTVSGHKIHAPKGVGALYVSPAIHKAKTLIPYLWGGGQESGFRAGTENLIGICGFGAATEVGLTHRDARIAHMTDLRDTLRGKLSDMGLQINIPQGASAPHIVSVTLPRIKSQTMLSFLSAQGICVSSGSACSAKATTPSASLLAFGLPTAEADSTLRISLCHENTEEDIQALISVLQKGLDTLVRMKR